MLHRVFRVVYLSMLFCSVLLASTSTVKKENLQLPHERYTLENGLEVILQHDPSTTQVAVNVWYHVGSIDEKAGKTGFAHLFEHLMFEGSLHTGNQHFKLLKEAGASLINGSTSFERTNYYEVVPANELELALWLESDRMGFFIDTITQAKLDEQRGVVKNERREHYENPPYALVAYQFWQHLFPNTHPFYGQPIGSMADLDAASLEDVKNFFKTHYTPANASLAIVGNFNPKTIRSLVDKYFASLKGNPKPPKAQIPFVDLQNGFTLELSEPHGKLTQVSMVYVSPAVFSEADSNCDIIAALLTGTQSSRLSKALQYDAQLVQSVDASQMSEQGLSLFQIDLMLREGQDPKSLIAHTQTILDSLITKPPSLQEIQAVVAKIRNAKVFSLQKIATRADLLQHYNHITGNPDALAFDLGRYDNVTPASIANTVKTWLSATKRATLIARPQTAEVKS